MKRRRVLENFRFANLVPVFVHFTPEGASIMQGKVQSYRLLRYSERKRKTPRFAANVRVRGRAWYRVVPVDGIEFFVETTGPIWRLQSQKTWSSVC
jgi:hypothetical protein